MRCNLFVPALFLSTLSLQAQQPCVTTEPTATFAIHHLKGKPNLALNGTAAPWTHAAVESMSKDCSRQIDYPHIKTAIRAFWTDQDLYLLFSCPYTDLNLFLPADNSKKHVGLWDRDVVEMFLGDDW